MGRLGNSSAPRTLCTEEGAVVSTFGWMDAVDIYWPLGCSSAQAAAAAAAAALCLTEAAVRTGGWRRVRLLRGAPGPLSAAALLLLPCCFLCLSFTVFSWVCK